MDRTKEFIAIVEYLQIPQLPYNKPKFFSDIYLMECEIEETIKQLSKLTAYESFRGHSLISKCSTLLKKYKNIKIDQNGSRDYCQTAQNITSIIKKRYLKYTLKFNDLSRKLDNLDKKSSKPTNDNMIEDDISKGTEIENKKQKEYYRQQQSTYFQVPLIEETQQDFTQERRRIINSITEIGQIVEDISLHVNLQEEQLKRIDDVILQADSWNQKAFNELNDLWGMFRSNRSFMIKFATFWSIILLVFWAMRKL